MFGDEDIAALEDDLMAEYTQRQTAHAEARAEVEREAAAVAGPAAGGMLASIELPPVPLYDPAHVPVLSVQSMPGMGQEGSAQPFLSRRWGPLPAWAWLLAGGGVAAGGWWWWSKRGTGSSGEPREPELGEKVPSGTRELAPMTANGPSRSGFAEKLQAYFDKKGFGPHVTVWHDAEEAQSRGKMRVVSPLVNMQVLDAEVVKVDAALQRWARREGLNPVQHADGSIGFYPHSSSKRGKEWESYVDALRDDGQTI